MMAIRKLYGTSNAIVLTSCNSFVNLGSIQYSTYLHYQYNLYTDLCKLLDKKVT